MNIRALLPLTLPWQTISCDASTAVITTSGAVSSIALKGVAKISSKEYTSLLFHRFDVELTMNSSEEHWLFNIPPQGFSIMKANVSVANPNVIIEESRIFSASPTMFGFRFALRTFKDSSTVKYSLEKNKWVTLLAIIVFLALLFYIARRTGNI